MSDATHGFSQALGAIVLKKLYGREYFGPSRSAYALDASGRLLGLVERVEAGRHGEQLLELAASLA